MPGTFSIRIISSGSSVLHVDSGDDVRKPLEGSVGSGQSSIIVYNIRGRGSDSDVKSLNLSRRGYKVDPAGRLSEIRAEAADVSVPLNDLVIDALREAYSA